MNNVVTTRHGAIRIRQRGMKGNDVTRILAYATQVDDETWMLREQDVNHAIRSCKQEIQALERLRNFKLVMCTDGVVTAYPSRPADQKRTLRRGRRKGLGK